MNVYTISDINLFNVARVFNPDYIPDGMTAKYELSGTTYRFPCKVSVTRTYDDRQTALEAFDRFCEEDPECDCSVTETIYAANGEVFNVETIADYWY